MSDKYPKGDNPDFNVLPTPHKGGTATGRFVGKRDIEFLKLPDPARQLMRPRRHAEPITVTISKRGSTSAALAQMVNADYSEIERRVMTNMQVESEKMLGHTIRPEEYGDGQTFHVRAVSFNLVVIRIMDMWLANMWGYADIEAVQQRIDEEGCGTFMCAARMTCDE